MKRFPLIALLVLALASLIVAIKLYPRAFPIANVPFNVSRAEAQEVMAEFVEELGLPLEGYKATCSFGEESEDKNFIDLRYGTQRLEEATRSGVNLWYWVGRWFKPGQHEEVRVWLDPEGAVVGFKHILEEETARPFIDQAAARKLAEEFLAQRMARHPQEQLRFVEESAEKKPARTDYSFAWERDDLRLDDAPYRLWVTVQGDSIGSYGEGLRVPEWWTRDYAQKRELNTLCSEIAGYFSLAILLGAFVYFVRAIPSHQVRWRDGASWGWLAFLGAVSLLAAINAFPDSLFAYRTTQNWHTFLAQSGFSALRDALSGVLGFWLLFVVADLFYRDLSSRNVAGNRADLPLGRLLGGAALRDPQTVRALGVGIVFALFSLAYVSLFYVAGQRWGVWCPVNIDYSKTLGGWLPWVGPLQTGLMAAFSEEMLFRVVALVVIWRLVRVRWVAVLLSSAVWAFLHSDYPQMPGYVRGLELTVEGAIWAVLLLRYGIVSTLTAHYLYNCWLGSMVLLQSASWGNKAGALAVSLWPVALFGWGWLRKGAAPIPQKAASPPAPAVKAEALPASRPEPKLDLAPATFSPKQLTLLLAIAVAAAALMLFVPQPREKFASQGSVDLSREQIAARADAHLRERGFNPESYRRIVTLSSSRVRNWRYLLEHGTLARFTTLFQEEWPDLKWRIRYFQILETEEFTLQLDKQGELIYWDHTVPRESPGAQLERDAALERVREAAAREYKIDFTQEKLVSEKQIQQENRRDWRFAFERNDFEWGEAQLRTGLYLQGDEVGNFNRFVKVPEAWLLEQSKSGWKKFTTTELKSWKSLGQGILTLTLFILLIYKRLIPWRQGFILALFPLLLSMIEKLNTVPWFYASYTTTTPLATYWISKLGGDILLTLALMYLLSAFLIGVALGFMRWAFGWSLRDAVFWPMDRAERAHFWRSTLLVGLSTALLLTFLDFATQTASDYWFPQRGVSFSYPSLNSSLPWLNAITKASVDGFLQLLQYGIYAGFIGVIWRRFPKTAWGLLLVSPLLSAISERTLPEFAFSLSIGLLKLGLIVWLLLRVWRFNPVLIFLVYAGQSLVGSIMLFLAKGGPNYQAQATPLLLFCIAVGIAGLSAHLRAQPALAREHS